MYQLTVNGERHAVDVPADMPLLWVLRDIVGLSGTKFGCGIAQCGACTVQLAGDPVRSCVLPAAQAAGKAITTIEGIGAIPVGAALLLCTTGETIGADEALRIGLVQEVVPAADARRTHPGTECPKMAHFFPEYHNLAIFVQPLISPPLMRGTERVPPQPLCATVPGAAEPLPQSSHRSQR